MHSGKRSHNCNHYNGMLYIFGKARLLSFQTCMFHYDRLQITGLLILKLICLLLFFNMNIPVDICVRDLIFSVWVLQVPPEERVLQFFH